MAAAAMFIFASALVAFVITIIIILYNESNTPPPPVVRGLGTPTTGPESTCPVATACFPGRSSGEGKFCGYLTNNVLLKAPVDCCDPAC